MRKEQLEGDTIFVIHDFLPPEECERLIALSEKTGYEDAPITSGSGFVMRKDVRNNDRVMLDAPLLAADLWERARLFLPAVWFGWEVVGFNERIRFYRYGPGQKFASHTDGYYERDNGERSQLTFMAYLNGDCEGGATTFYRSRGRLDVQPERGKALVFAHKVLHEGTAVVGGRKYVLRTDVMYRRLPVAAGSP
jgi:hypothetical protein